MLMRAASSRFLKNSSPYTVVGGKVARLSIVGVDLVIDFVAVDGRRIFHDFEPWLKYDEDINTDMDQSASKIAWAGSVHGLLHEANDVLDAEYRAWRADQGEKLLTMNEKLSEYKIKQLIESAPDFVTYKKKRAEMKRKLWSMNAISNALGSYADTLRSRGANRRAEFKAIGMTTPEEPEPASTYERSDETRERAVEAAFNETDKRAKRRK